MGYDYSLSTNNYFRFIPASYGIMNAIHGTSDNLREIDLDSMVTKGYNTFSYYNYLNNINDRTSSLFSIIANAGRCNYAGYGNYGGGAVGGSNSSNQTQSSEGKKKGDDIEKAEYDSKLGFIEDLIKSQKLSGYSKTIADIKKRNMTYKKAIEELDALLEDIHSKHRSALENYANEKAKSRYTNTQDGSAMGIASEAINEIGSWFRKDMSSTQLDNLLSRLSNLNESNILDFIREYQSLSGKDIISQIQEILPEHKQIRLDGKRVQKKNGNDNWYWGFFFNSDRKASRARNFENKIDSIMKRVCSALIAKAETYRDHMDATEVAHLDTLITTSSGTKLRKKPTLGSEMMQVYNDIKDMDAKIANRQVKKEIEGYLPAGCTVNVTGAKTKHNCPSDPVGNVPSSKTFGVYAN